MSDQRRRAPRVSVSAATKPVGGLLSFAAALAALSGCASADTAAASASAAATTTVTVTVAPTETVTVTATPDAPRSPVARKKTKPRLFPAGYPKVVSVSSLPFQVRSAYEGQYAKAVAIAPGVWSPLAPGATVMDTATSGVADGFCGSIKSYERHYLHGRALGGSCW